MCAVAEDEGWWCWECHGLGGWEEDGADRGDFGETEDVQCGCCGGDGWHYGDEPPPCGRPIRERPAILPGETT